VANHIFDVEVHAYKDILSARVKRFKDYKITFIVYAIMTSKME